MYLTFLQCKGFYRSINLLFIFCCFFQTLAGIDENVWAALVAHSRQAKKYNIHTIRI